ncbi:MAG: glycosyltransferase family 2 protein [Candidatus Pacebacteria bacterium]|nr:glycosyltransferase family 2 protein [Candidatus Paceibacterota bacterium]
MEFKESIYYRVGKASDLTGKDYFIYRILEIIPGFLAWFTILSIFLFSFLMPFYCAVFIIVFDVYWILKTLYLSIYLRQNWKRSKHNLSLDWKEKLSNLKYDRIHHVILLPFYNESWEIVEKSLKSIINCEYKKDKLIVVLAAEEREKAHSLEIFEKAKKEFSNVFEYLFFTLHPSDVVGEIKGKGSNIAYCIEEVRKEILDKNKINYEDVLVSAFDIDTVVYPQYFECLTWNFLTAEDPLKSSFQPIPVFTNNIWESPALSRVVSFSATFWQMIQQERPEILATFSSHSVCFKTLYDVGYWQKNIVSEDSRIFWNSLLAYDGNYKVVPLSYPVSMDANLAQTFWQTVKNVYKQQRRWAWGVENGPYVLFGFLKNKKISKLKKLKFTFVMYEGFWSLSTNPLIIFFLGWLPIIFGGRDFNSTILSYNLPMVTKTLMTLSMLGLFLCAIISSSFIPLAPSWVKRSHKIAMIVQWILIPLTIIIFGAIPGLDAQTRLMFGKYMGFWVTPKYRKK